MTRRSIRTLLFIGALIVLGTSLAVQSTAADLTWRGIDISKQGAAKGATLPLSVGSPVFGFQFLKEDPFPEELPPNALLTVNTTIYNSASHLMGPDGEELSGPHHLDAAVDLFQIFYFFPLQPESPHLHFFSHLIAPIFQTVHASVAPNPLPGNPNGIGLGAGGGGIGDVLWNPVGFLYTDTHSAFAQKWLKFTYFLNPLIQFPTGVYDAHNLFNTGSNVFAFTPATAFIWEPGAKFGPYLSRLSVENSNLYVYSFTNHSFTMPFTISGQSPILTAGSQQPYRTGQLYMIDSDFWYRVRDGFRFGITVNWLQQLTDDLLRGSQIHNSMMQEVSIGPTAYLTMGSWMMLLKIPFNVKSVNAYDATQVQFSIGYLLL